jgi:hypothetical protein
MCSPCPVTVGLCSKNRLHFFVTGDDMNHKPLHSDEFLSHNLVRGETWGLTLDAKYLRLFPFSPPYDPRQKLLYLSDRTHIFLYPVETCNVF